MGFCGKSGYTLPESSAFSECLTDVLIIGVHVIFVAVAGVTSLARWLKTRSPCDITTETSRSAWVRFPGHDLRWVLTLIAATMNVFELCEGLLVEMGSSSPRLHLYVPPVIVLVSAIFSLAFYDFVETFNLPRLLLMLTIYWMGALTVKLFKLVALYKAGYEGHHVRVTLAWCVIVCYLGLILVELNAVHKLRYVCARISLARPAMEQEDIQYIHPYTNFLSHATWHWLTPLLAQGYKKPLEMLDLGKIPKTEHSKENFHRFKAIFEEEKLKAEETGSAPSLWWCYVRCYWPMMAVCGVYKLIADLLIFVPPMCLDGIVSYLITKDEQGRHVNMTYPLEAEPMTIGEYFSNGYTLALLTAVAAILQVVLLQNNFYISTRQGIRCKGAIQALVYDKTLRLSTWSLSEGDMDPGQVMNHMAVDPTHLFMLFYLFHFTWSLPMQIIVTFILLYIQLGYAALISGVLVLFLCPFQYLVGKKLAQVQKETLERADERLKKSTEVLQSIKLLKLYAWEAIFQRSIEKTRLKELKLLLRAALYRVLSISVVDGAPVAATLITFTVYPYLENKPLEAAKVFSSLTLFSILGLPLYIVTMIINAVAHARVSTARLLTFLMSPEVKVNQPPPEEEVVSRSQELKSNGAIQEMAEFEKVPDVSVKPIVIPSITFDLAPDIDQNADDVDLTTEPLISETKTTDPNATDNHVQKDPILDEDMEDDNVALRVVDGTFSWDLDGKEPFLQNINVEIPKGKLTVVVGSVGSGKSSILSAILGEMTMVTGEVEINENLRIAYGAQKAWLINATLRDNILFGHHYEHERYDQVIRHCALEPDIGILPAGDQTEIGEKGINLSGGQKQRLSIARTLYSAADMVILDDPLSALDVHVGSHIFQHAILRHLLSRDRTVILVTHQLQYLPYAHKILVMKDGRIQHDGTLGEIKAADPELYAGWNAAITQSKGELPSPISPCDDDDNDSHGITELTAQMERRGEFPGQGTIRSALSMVSLSHLDTTDEADYVKPDTSSQRDTPDIKDLETGKLVEEEERAIGSVSVRVYIDYARAATWTLTLLTIGGYMVRQGIRMGTDYWLAEWSDSSREVTSRSLQPTPVQTIVSIGGSSVSPSTPYVSPPQYYPNTTYSQPTQAATSDVDIGYWVRGYAGLCVTSILLSGPVILVLEAMCLLAARNLHNSMIKAVISAPMRFFDTTPVGRIVNRLAGDTNTIDERMPFTWDALLFSFFYVLGGIVMNAVSMPFFIIPAIPMVIVFLAVQRFYIASSRELQRLDNITRSPILAHFSETLGGLPTIRAYRDQRRFQQQNWRSVDQNNTAFLYLHTANVWMGVRLDLLGAMIVFVAALCSITSSLYGYANPSLAGLAIAYAIMISTFLNWTMRHISEIEMWFSCVQRVDQYCHIPSEPYHTDGEVIPAASWPTQGEVRMERVSLRYHSSLDTVIRQLTLHIKGGEKVGICGRTGSGKSSLTLGLFRLIDICEGQIFIDNIDISKVPLATLRSRLSIIPQDPVLFAGTVRFNMDPDDIYSDEAIWKAIEIAQLRDTISALSKQLDAPVTDGGENFSQGQRQLFCLARAFLRDSRVLIMDEATASIDMETDHLIQKIMQTAFKDRTVITVAHRVATILNYDSIIVLQNGEIIEHDSPQSLLATDSIFASMVQDNK